MKKLNLYSFFILNLFFMLFITTNLNAQRWVSKKVEKRKVVLEEFTGFHCGYCPDGHRIANALKKNRPDDIFLVNIHSGPFSSPGANELDFRVNDGIELDKYMGASSYPTAAVNREIVKNGDNYIWLFGRGNWEYLSNLILNENAPVNIAVRARVNPDTRKLTVEVELYYTSTCTSPNYITVMLTQDSILGTQSNAQTFYPENIDPTTGKYIHSHVLRKIITPNGYKGDPVTTVNEGNYVYRKYEWVLPNEINKIPLVIEKLNVVAHVCSDITLTSGVPLKAYNAAGTKVSTSLAEETEKLVLLEEFTNVNSEACEKLNVKDGLNKYLQNNTGRVVSVVYHTNINGEDPMNNFDKVFPYQRGINYYGIQTVPAVFVDGKKVSNNSLDAIKQAISSTSNASYITLLPNFTIDNSNKLKVNVEVKSGVQYTSLALRVVVLEAGIFYPKEAPAGTNGEEEFFFVARYMLPDATGSKFGIEANGSRKFDFTKDLDPNLDKSKIYVAVFVQNETDKSVLQTAVTRNLAFLSFDVAPVGNIYSIVNEGAEKTHIIEITNTSNIPIVATVINSDKELGFLSNDQWEFTTSAPGASTNINIPVNSKKSFSYGVKPKDSKLPSSFINGCRVEITDYTLPNNFNPGIVVIQNSRGVNFIDVTSATKSIYLCAMNSLEQENDNIVNSILANEGAFKQTSLLKDNFAPLFVHKTTRDNLFDSDFLNNFEFIATTIDEYNYDILINDNASLFNKLSDFISKGTKIYVSANKLLEIANDGTILTPKQTKAINDFYKNQFGVVSVDKKSNIETPLTIKGIDSNIDTTKYSLYGNETGHFVDYFNINTPNIASGIFTTETDNKIVAVKANNAYDDKKNRRLLLGFDLLGIDEENRAVLANKLVNWLYNEDGNIDIKNTLEGLNIYVQNNPIMYDSKIILTNNNPFVTVINLYLIDINGNKVANIFNGPISYGENTFSFNNDMMSSGKYMLILENTKGRQIGLPVMVVK